MPKIFPFDQPFDEAVKWFKAKNVVTRSEFDQMDKTLKARAFTAAYVESADLLNEVYKATELGISKGQSYHEFSHDVEEILTGPWHRETVFRTNTLAAYGLGHFQQAKSLAKLRPYVRYTAIMDARTRPAHALLHGTTFAMDDGAVADIWPPIGYNCRCTMYSLTDSEVKSEGLEISPAKDFEPDPGFSSPALGGWFDPKTSSWQPFVEHEFKKATQHLPELDPKGRYDTLEVTPWDYTPSEINPGTARVAEEDLGLVKPKAPAAALTEGMGAVDPLAWDPDLELEFQAKKQVPLYESPIKVPPGKYYDFKIPGLKQIEIAEEDLLAGLTKPAAQELTAGEKAWIQGNVEKIMWENVQAGHVYNDLPTTKASLIQDHEAIALQKKIAGETLPSMVGFDTVADVLKIEPVKLTPGEKAWIESKIKKEIAEQKINTPGMSASYWKTETKLQTAEMEKIHLEQKAAGGIIPTAKKVTLNAAEKAELKKAVHAYLTEKLQAEGYQFTSQGYLDVANLSPTDLEKIKGMEATVTKQLTKSWTQIKSEGELDNLIATIKKNAEAAAGQKTAALAKEASDWAAKQAYEYLMEAPEGAKPAPEWIAKYKLELEQAYIKKGGIPNVVLSHDAGGGIIKAADPVAPGAWREFESRSPAHEYGLKTWGAWRSSLSGPELSAMRAYKGSGYRPINMWLRTGSSTSGYGGTSTKTLVENMDKAMMKGKFIEPFKVFRGCSMKIFNDHGARTAADLPKLVGSNIVDKGFPSCGFTERSAWGHKGVLWEIRCPPGTPGAYIDQLQVNTGEYEILLGRNLTYKVISVDLNYQWAGRTIPKVVSEVIL